MQANCRQSQSLDIVMGCVIKQNGQAMENQAASNIRLWSLQQDLPLDCCLVWIQTHSLHFGHFWISIISNIYKDKFHWWWLRASTHNHHSSELNEEILENTHEASQPHWSNSDGRHLIELVVRINLFLYHFPCLFMEIDPCRERKFTNVCLIKFLSLNYGMFN